MGKKTLAFKAKVIAMLNQPKCSFAQVEAGCNANFQLAFKARLQSRIAESKSSSLM